MKNKMALVITAIFIFFSGCSSPNNVRAVSSISSSEGSTSVQSSTLVVKSSPSSDDTPVQSGDPISSTSTSGVPSASPNSQANINSEGDQINISGSNTSDIPKGECLEPYHIGFNIENLSKKPITKIFIRAIDLDGCAVDVDESQNQLPLNKNYPGTEWIYDGTIDPNAIGLCGFYIIPKQLKYQTLTFQFYMADGKTPFKNANNNPALVKVRFEINGGSDMPTSEPFNAQDIDIGGKLVYSQDSQKQSIVFTIKNNAYFNDLNGIMAKISVNDYKGYKIEPMQGGSVSIEGGNYVWKFPQVLPRRMSEGITITCPFDKAPPSGFDFYTIDGKTRISTCKIFS